LVALAREQGVVISQPAMLTVDDVEPTALVSIDAGFDDFVRCHGQELCRAAFLLTGDRQLAEDLVQMALAKVAGRWERVVAKGDPTPYVRTMVVRLAIAWRRRRWQGEIPTSPLPERSGTDPVGALDGRDRLRRALLLVPPRQRAALVLRFYEDLSEADTASAMGCSVGTVKSQTAKGLARLRTLLADESISPDQGA
jgi:RNA polymerase sigma-70 factor (sigma-E family)